MNPWTSNWLAEGNEQVQRIRGFISKSHLFKALAAGILAILIPFLVEDVIITKFAGSILAGISIYQLASMRQIVYSAIFHEKTLDGDAYARSWREAELGCWAWIIAIIATVVYFVLVA